MSHKLQKYNRLVLNKYHIYNSLFMNLPYEKMANIGTLIPILLMDSKAGFEKGKNPLEIIEEFFERHTNFKKGKEQTDFLFRVIQYIERQVVLFDAIEDAAFEEIQKLSGGQSFKDIYQASKVKNRSKKLIEKLKDFGIRIVFTAHPTQFYPPSVQRIIHDLSDAITNNSLDNVDALLQQLGKTSFLNQIKPTPYEEAKSIIYYLRNVYYDAIADLFQNIEEHISEDNFDNYRLIQLGFWPGGDRDGNPYVTAETTRKVADELRMTLMKCYYNNLKKLRRRLTFEFVEPILEDLSNRLYKNMFALESELTATEILDSLTQAKQVLVERHNSLFLKGLDNLIYKVKIFGTHFATLDIRQDARIHTKVVKGIIEKYNLSDVPFEEIPREKMIEILTQTNISVHENLFKDPIIADTIKNIKQLKTIQRHNGEQGCNRYIISNSEGIFAVLNVYGLFKFCGWKDEDIQMDIVPLFETIKGLSAAESVMNELYNLPIYAEHLKRRKQKQTIMLGFSDGTKDGGYLKANWEIFKTKETLSKVSHQNDVKVVFFDGRGGPPARGGGKTHRFYASKGKNIANNEIQLTIQGQTITSMYGTPEQFSNSCEQLILAGLSNDIFEDEKTRFSSEERALMTELGDLSFQKYQDLKHHPKFIPYLEKMSTLKYYGRANIGSRPSKRGNKVQLTLDDLRAISFVGSWSQLKQNVPGYFGIGTAILNLKEAGRMDEVKQLFQSSAFFKSLILNSMMSMTKTFFPLTAYMKEHSEFSEFWQILFDEFELSKQMMLEISGYQTLMEEEVISRESIGIRERIVLPLLTIQQYALQKIAGNSEDKAVYEKMVTRSLYGNVNASRNSA